MNYIACVDENWGIGKNGDLLFSIKGDMKFFRETTLGKTVVMGRKTLLSFPGSKPLKNRRNIVLTKNRDFSCEGAEIVHSTEELSALLKNDKADSDNIFVIGGAQIYNALYKFCKTAYITKVSADGNADVFIKDLDKEQDWMVSSKSQSFCENGLEYTSYTYENSSPESFL